jgi:hypothetical protein
MAFQVTMVVDYSENYQLNEAVPSLVVRNYLRILNVPCRIFLPAPSLTCPNLALTMNLSIWCCTLPHVLTLSSLLAEQSFLIAAREILSFLKWRLLIKRLKISRQVPKIICSHHEQHQSETSVLYNKATENLGYDQMMDHFVQVTPSD